MNETSEYPQNSQVLSIEFEGLTLTFADTEDQEHYPEYDQWMDEFEFPSYETPENLYTGMSGEDLELALMQDCFEPSIGWRVKHNDLTNTETYCRGKGMDMILQSPRNGYENMVAIEVKNYNPNQQEHRYGTNWVKKEVLARYRDTEARIKLLVITNIKLLNEEAITLLYNEGWAIFETGVQLTQELYIQETKFREIAKRLQNLLTAKFKELRLFPFNHSNIYYKPNSTIENKTNYQNEISYKTNYDTPMVKSDLLGSSARQKGGTTHSFIPPQEGFSPNI